MKRNTLLFITALLIVSCHHNTASKKLDKAWIDSIAKHSDSSYTKPYYRSDYVTADYYVGKKDSALTQMMKDSAGIIRQVIITKKNIKTFFGQYYTNGQLQADLKMDDMGRYNGPVTYYFEDGTIKTTGTYTHGLSTGQWKNFDEKGKLISTENYNDNGQPIK